MVLDVIAAIGTLSLLIVVMYLLISRYGLASYEGVGTALYSITLIPPMLFALISHESELISLYMYSNLIHTIGFISLLFGLVMVDIVVGNGRLALKQSRRIPHGADKLNQFSTIAILLGISLAISGYISAGFDFSDLVFANKSSYVLEKGFLGGWLDKGLVLVDVGLVIKICLSRSQIWKILFIVLMIGAHYALSMSRGGLLSVLLILLIASLYYSIPLKRLYGTILVVIVSSAALGGLATLARWDQSQSNTTLDISLVGNTFKERVADRFGAEGLADGYANIISRLEAGEHSWADGQVLSYSVISNVPAFIYSDKPMHPMRATGTLVYRDRPAPNYEDVSAFGLVGSAYYDFGLVSLCAYLWLLGVLLSICRTLFLKFDHTGFIYFTFIFMDGATNFIHGGITTVIGGLILTILFSLVIVGTWKVFNAMRLMVPKVHYAQY